MLGAIDRESPILHLVVFAGFALGVSALCGSATPWPVLLGVAALSEIVPSQLGWRFEASDLLDLIENLAGVGIGLLAWWLGRRLLARRRGRPA